jgi:hypothetical protein
MFGYRPYVELLDNRLNTEQMKEIFERYKEIKKPKPILFNFFMKIFSLLFGLFYETQKITESQWTVEDKKYLDCLYLTHLENDIFTKQQLYPITDKYFARIYGLKYSGNGWFSWHFDSNSENEYRALYLVSQSGIQKFKYLDENFCIKTLDLTEGQGILIRGSTTLHTVTSGNPNDHRWVIVFTYTKNKNDNRKIVCISDLYFQLLKLFFK